MLLLMMNAMGVILHVALVLQVHTMILNRPITTLLVLEPVQEQIVLHTLKPVTLNVLLETHVKVKDMLIHVHQEKHVYQEQYPGQYHIQTVHHQKRVNSYAPHPHVLTTMMVQVLIGLMILQ
jgi:hypothetical protein